MLELQDRISGRLLKSLVMAGGDPRAAAAFAASQNWHNGDLVAKAATGGLESSGNDGLASFANQDFAAIAWPRTFLGQMPFARRTNFRTPGIQQTSGAVGHWLEQGKAAKHNPPAFSRLSPLESRKVVAMTVATIEAARTEGADAMLLDELANAVELAFNQAFVDAVVGDAARPSAINYNVSPTSSTGDPVADVQAALTGFGGDLRTSCWLTSPAVAAAAGLHLNSGGSANDCGATGGRLAGLPVLTSEACEVDSSGGDLILIDQRAVQFAGGIVELKTSTAGTIEMDGASPTGDALAPTSASATPVGLWQIDAIALLAVLVVNWRLVRTNACAVISDCAYAAA